MKEIKFRARHSITGIWHYGCVNPIDLTEHHLGVFFQELEAGVFDARTAGQYTGLLDKQGKEIYEGDIVKCRCAGTFVVEWSDHYGRVMAVDKAFGHWATKLETNSIVEVIGTIHENPELLKEVTND